MENAIKSSFFETLKRKYGRLNRLENTLSLFEIEQGKTRIYIRYSKKHPGNRTFFGLRQIDLKQLEGHPAVLCFLWDQQKEPLIIPFNEFEEIFNTIKPASDGQYKVQVYEETEGSELYIAGAGRFNIDSYFGWEALDNIQTETNITIPELSHSQVQTLLGAIGVSKGYDIWLPHNDRCKIDSNLANNLVFPKALPGCLDSIRNVAEEIDVMWFERGAASPRAFFEVEHSTPIYSGLLRFNDIRIVLPQINARFGIVSNEERRVAFARQILRPTFKASGLSEYCMFFEYSNVYNWHHRLTERRH